MSSKVRFYYTISLIIDLVITLLYFDFLFQMQDVILVQSSTRVFAYTANLVDVMFVIFIISYFITYPLRNDKRTLSEKLLKIKIENQKEIKISEIVLTNIVFWISIGILVIRIFEFENINFHSIAILSFGAIIYLLFLILGIDFISIFGSNIKLKKE